MSQTPAVAAPSAVAAGAAHCDGVAYVVARQRVAGTRDAQRSKGRRGDGRRVLGRLDMRTGAVRPIAPKPGLDALGYNTRDGLLYGVENSPVDGGSPNLITIDPRDGATLASVSLPPDAYTAGAISRDGLFYVRGRDDVTVMDVKAKPARIVRSFVLSSDVKLDDFAVRPADGRIYGVDNATGDLVRISPRTGVVKWFGGLALGRVTAAFFDTSGTLRVAGARIASVDVAKLPSRSKHLDVRRVGVLPVRPPKLLDGAGCLKGVPKLVSDAAPPKIAPPSTAAKSG
ncbi:DUF6923 family protein [Actinomadura harenae]|uniref:DUF6923 family protein n=1 Tax=Actinomadura harenae TaxID=2483351 RepID=UPI0011C3EF14|nr:hypothetical protein [Actinomadura harenae]